MKILSNGNIDIEKQTIYMDVDDVILNTRDTIIQLIRNKYKTEDKEENMKQEKSWNFKTTYRNLSEKELLSFFDSNEFWDNVKYKKSFLKILESGILDKYNLILVTKGSEKNIQLKFNYLSKKMNFNNIGYIGVEEKEDKAKVKMYEGIQIDDNYNFLKNTDARIKILYREEGNENDVNSYWLIKDNLTRLYVCTNQDELIDFLQFNYELHNDYNISL